MSFRPPQRHPRVLVAVVAAAVCVLSLATPSAALADDAQQQAQQLFSEGRDYFNDSEYLRAAEAFLEVEKLLETPPPELYFNIGQAYLRAEELAEAEQFLQQYLNEATDPPNEDDVVEMIIDIQEERAAQIASIELASEPAGAEIFVDGQSRCQAPCSLDLDPGEYSLRATLRDHIDATKDVELSPREQKELTIALEEEVFFGHLELRTDVDDAVLSIDDREYSLPLSAPLELETGSYTVTVRHGDNIVTHAVDIERDDSLHLFIPMAAVGQDEGLSPLRTTAIGLGGASVALAIAATATGMQARSTHQSLETRQSSAGFVDADLVASGQRQRRATNFLWLGAAATLATGAGLWTWDAMGSSDDASDLEPTEVDEDDGGSDEPGADAEDTPDVDVLD